MNRSMSLAVEADIHVRNTVFHEASHSSLAIWQCRKTSILVTEHIIGSGQVRNRVFVPGGSQQAPGICYGRIIPRVGLDWGIGPASTRNCVGVAIVGVDFTEPFMPEHF